MLSKQLAAATPRLLRSQTRKLFKNHARSFSNGATVEKHKITRAAWIAAGAVAIALVGTGATKIVSAQSVQPATSEAEKKQRATFDKHASLEKVGERYMTADDFLSAITARQHGYSPSWCFG